LNAVEIANLRSKLSLNQVEFAQLVGVHPITVSKWERGVAAPTAYQTALFAQFQEGAKDQEVRQTLKQVLVAAGVILALALLLRHLMKGK
jgi:DNA-binding transcriptional regulator YiaG